MAFNWRCCCGDAGAVSSDGRGGSGSGSVDRSGGSVDVPDVRSAGVCSPFSRFAQRRIVASLHMCMRGYMSVFGFQTGGVPLPQLQSAESDDACVAPIACGHTTLLYSGSVAFRLAEAARGARLMEAVRDAVRGGHEATVRWVVEGGSGCTDSIRNAFLACALQGYLLPEVLQLAFEHGYMFVAETIMVHAAAAGSNSNNSHTSSGERGSDNRINSKTQNKHSKTNKSISSRAHSERQKAKLFNALLCAAAAQGSLHLLEMFAKYAPPPRVAQTAADAAQDMQNAYDLLCSAALGGSKDVFLWVEQRVGRGQEMDAARSVVLAATRSAGRGRQMELDLLEYLHSVDAYTRHFDQSAFDEAVHTGSVPVLEWLTTHVPDAAYPRYQAVGLADVAAEGHVAMLEHIVRLETPDTARKQLAPAGIRRVAAASVDSTLTTIEFLHAHDLDHIGEAEILAAALTHNLRPRVLTFLAHHCLQTDWVAAMRHPGVQSKLRVLDMMQDIHDTVFGVSVRFTE